MQSETLMRLASVFRRLPTVGQKTALRYAYAFIRLSDEDAEYFIDALQEAREKLHLCPICGDYTEAEGACERCREGGETICVVKEPKDIPAIENMGAYRGMYHVLHGTLDFQKGIGAEQLRIKELLARLDGSIKEVIIATNPDVGGEMTAAYLAQIIKPLGVRVTRLAHGISMGSEIEFTDEMTMQRAFMDRKPL